MLVLLAFRPLGGPDGPALRVRELGHYTEVALQHLTPEETARLIALKLEQWLGSAATLPPTTPAKTTVSTNTSAGVARVAWASTGMSRAAATASDPRPSAVPKRGAPPVGGSRLITRNFDAILTPIGPLLTVP